LINIVRPTRWLTTISVVLSVGFVGYQIGQCEQSITDESKLKEQLKLHNRKSENWLNKIISLNYRYLLYFVSGNHLLCLGTI